MPGERHQPPPGLTPAQAATWRKIVATKPAEWFSEDSHALLEQYCRCKATLDVLERRVERLQTALDDAGDDASPHAEGHLIELLKARGKEAAMLNAYARSMRLTQQSRIKAETAGTADKRAGGARKPWEA